jgi:hypothetical protein
MKFWKVIPLSLLFAAARAQSPIGTVSLNDASVTNASGGIVSTSAGRATLSGTAIVSAHARPAAITLDRGGELRACQGTAVHLTAIAGQSLLFALDRGSLELRTKTNPGDTLLTPDLRITFSDAAPLDLQLRVTPAGDTCIDNRGKQGPTLTLTDSFGEATYLLKPGQHVTFEHGSLREVVDHETVPCGCPPDDLPPGLTQGSIADAILSGGSASAHPFPAAVSGGLVPPSPLPPQPAGQTHTQVSATLNYNPSAAAPAPTPQATPVAAATPPTQAKPNAFTAIGHFFKRLFAR